jgi:hypothetical protein
MFFSGRESSRKRRSAIVSQLRVEQLEDRLVPSVSLLNLTTPGASVALKSASQHNTVAIFEQTATQPSGDIQSFLRLESHWFQLEQGYNTDARPLQFAETTDRHFTHSLKLSDVPVVMLNSVAYRQFLLEVNEPAWSPFVSLDQLQIFVAGQGNLAHYNAFSTTLAGRSAVFDLDSAAVGGNHSVVINARPGHGHGPDEIFFYVADSVFSGVAPNQYVYLYSQFGSIFRANGGFEEWAVIKGGGTGGSGGGQTGGNTASLAGVVADNGTGLMGVKIDLINSNGVVVGTATTGTNGAYQFTGLAADTYKLSMEDPTLPALEQPLSASAGTVNSTSQGTPNPTSDGISGIVLGNGQSGINFNFFTQTVLV